ncbi:MAG TPA: heparinase II/III family protein [bacterium]|nr:heparinase II/III family protein [bacterium]HPN45614.1 heparinase II/III family protein [bacterium]
MLKHTCKRINIPGIVVLLTAIIFIFTADLAAVTHPIWNPTGNVDSLKNNVKNYLSLSNSQLRNKLDNSGKANTQNAAMVNITYDFALLYHLTGENRYADKAATLLARYAEVFPNWPLDYSDKRGHYMWWKNWFHRDLGEVARFLPQAYDLIATSGALERISQDTGQKVLTLFQQIVQVDLGYKLFFFNAAGTRPLGLMIFGRVLDDPELVHLGYWYYNRLIHEMFCHDGFWLEGSYEYGASIVGDITQKDYAFYCNGYSDPEGYTHIPFDPVWDPQRLDNLDFNAIFGDIYDRINFALWKTALPDDKWPVLNETFAFPTGYSNQQYHPQREPLTESRLFGGLGHAALTLGNGLEQIQTRFDFSNAIGHSHNDALHLIYFSKGVQVVGGTGYTEGNRDWNNSTINQNLVVVNAKEQKSESWNDRTPSPYIPGKGRIEGMPERLPFPDTNMHNNVIMFEPGFQDFKQVQVTEVDALDAYANSGATRYRRTLALVSISENDTYLVDLFRLQGGSQYDWCIHGGYDNYQITTNLNLKSASGKFGSIAIKKKAETNAAWYGEIAYANAKHRFTMCGAPATAVFTGKAPQSIKNGGQQDYLFARRMTNSNADENYLVVHETFTSAPHIRAVEKLIFTEETGSAVGIKVTLDNGRIDYIIHTLDDGPDFPEHKITGGDEILIRGKFAHIRMVGGSVEWMYLVQGKSLTVNSLAIESRNPEYSFRGIVNRVERRQEGAAANCLVVDTSLPAETLPGKSIILTWANGWNWAYTIKEATGNTITLNEEPGFTWNGDKINMRFFPAGQYLGPVQFIIPGIALLNGGQTISTEYIQSVDKTPPAIPKIKGARKDK